MSDWFETLAGLRSGVWSHLQARIADRPSLDGHPTLATVDPDGWPEARTVVLRGADPAMARVEVHTDRHSAKIASLRTTPRAALHLWLPDAALQIRLWLDVTIRTGPEVEGLWATVPDRSRQSYGTDPPPGTPILDALAYTKPANPDAFAVLDCRVNRIDAVHLGEVHRRALFRRADNWVGQWLAP